MFIPPCRLSWKEEDVVLQLRIALNFYVGGVCVCVCVSHSVVSDSVTPWTVTHQVPLSVEFSRQEYWSGLPFSSPGDLPNPEIEPVSPALQADSLLSEPPGKPFMLVDVSLHQGLLKESRALCGGLDSWGLCHQTCLVALLPS